MQTILVVEDEDAISRVLAAYIRKIGFTCVVCADGAAAPAQFDALRPALVLLDVMLPGQSGWDILRHIRSRGAYPVIMLTARGELNDRLLGLNEGADDYIAKPFAPEEVIARIQAVLRRPTQSLETPEVKYFGSLKIDYRSRTVYLNGARLTITPRDLGLLLFLAERPNRIFEREQLIEQVWGIDYEGSDRAVDLAIKRLRKALLHWPQEEGEIRTLRGTGYQFYAKSNA
ncbi:response regulator transcription factor [Paenibacillus athensensis]|uniref:DNA-binding response regulator n=1 Tax=Paenibacillus athensensis TaxID=1967502 RepID=A0A4Y8PV94_9BACL|nr:response regulator transcription factor [Paenibacillus athensensis]MCD1258603.1 response regulator transcription factor [Paenibacillus athensensis]